MVNVARADLKKGEVKVSLDREENEEVNENCVKFNRRERVY